MAEIILQAEHLKKEFVKNKKSFAAADDVSFYIRKGEAVGLVGESGSGKSTIASMIMGLTSVSAGKVKFLGEDITGLKGKQLRQVYQNMQMIFQIPEESFDPRRTLGDGIGESLRNSGMRKTAVKNRVEELLHICGLPKEFADRYPHEVSGGQCQRAAIARALAIEPKLLICDEATSALDVTVQKQIMELLAELKQKMNLSFLFICHDLALVQFFCDRVLVLNNGKIVEEGNVETVIQNPCSDYTKRLLDSVL